MGPFLQKEPFFDFVGVSNILYNMVRSIFQCTMVALLLHVSTKLSRAHKDNAFGGGGGGGGGNG